MTRLLKHSLLALALAVICFGAAVESQATPLVITITSPVQSVTQGGTIVFSGTITNPNAQAFTINSLFLSGTATAIAQISDFFTPAGLPNRR